MSVGSAQGWPDAVVVPGGGEGTLARTGSVVLLVGSTDPAVVAPYLQQAREIARNGGEGRQLVRGFALMLLTSEEDSPGFAAVAPHERGLAVFLDGDVTLTYGDERVSGGESLAWVERLVPWPLEELSIVLGDAAAPSAGSCFRLDAGVVPAAALTITDEAPDAGAEADQHPEADAEPDAGVVAADAPLPEVPDADEQEQPEPAQAEAVDQDETETAVLPVEPVEPADEAAAPAAEPADEAAAPAVEAGDGDTVRGIYCPNDHFNDPRQLFCVICSANLVQRSLDLVDGPRPSLGVLAMDDGSSYPADGSYLLGRDPASDPRVDDGDYRGLPVVDDTNQVSRVHARIELRGWDVVLVDNESTNGTFVQARPTAEWQRLSSGGEQVLHDGMKVRIGGREFSLASEGAGRP
ncbi:MAG: FHA domain-containing protein [Nocardioidaceae bacterium]|nr:FHA domain-containing protein [Nocardioidaceae bacterium]MCL2612693.1 FHA domain-containing protein [Nocardioidaceae bacterium]